MKKYLLVFTVFVILTGCKNDGSNSEVVIKLAATPPMVETPKSVETPRPVATVKPAATETPKVEVNWAKSSTGNPFDLNSYPDPNAIMAMVDGDIEITVGQVNDYFTSFDNENKVNIKGAIFTLQAMTKLREKYPITEEEINDRIEKESARLERIGETPEVVKEWTTRPRVIEFLLSQKFKKDYPGGTVVTVFNTLGLHASIDYADVAFLK